ncbi:4-(cytidine 5'-diphospho)-2-C-methyl-D-erythritol kinase [Candidatus Pelagibacter sp.]|nr:4-(cytidine 5'-diphospho)-2-C-methyl-D-erythritol kinase [Candidatus Pelagibacter sp.]
MSYYKIKSYAKINLSLNVVGKKNFLHKIESIVSFLTLYDEIFIKKITNKNHKIRFIGKFSPNIKSQNTISRLLEIIDRKNLIKDKYQIIVKKNIPTQSGLGGGSMNAAFVLNFFIKNKILKISNKEIINIVKLIGSDVILGIYKKNLILTSNNKIKVFSIKKKYPVLVVKPNFGCSTKKIYSKFKKFTKVRLKNPSKNMFNIEFLKKMKNDLELIAIKEYPKLNSLKDYLEKLSYVEFVRMTGSGSAFVAYFKSYKKCKEAEKKVRKQFRNYWCKTSKTI